MTNEQINKAIAEKVMGWEVRRVSRGRGMYRFYFDENDRKVDANFTYDLNAAFEAWRKFEPTFEDAGYRTAFDGLGNVTVVIFKYGSTFETEICKDLSPAKALCLAILAALKESK
jgi:hypothetical protein